MIAVIAHASHTSERRRALPRIGGYNALVHEGLLEWYRPDQTRRVWRVLLAGAGIMTAGGLVMAISFLTHQREAVRTYAAVVGIVLTVCGGLTTVLGMTRILADDRYIAVKLEGLVVALGGDERHLAWGDLERIRFDDESHLLLLEPREGDAIAVDTKFAGKTGPDLAQRLDELRRKASFGVLRAGA